MNDIDFDELEKQVEENVEKKRSIIVSSDDTSNNEEKGMFSGWTKGPIIAGGIILGVVIIATLVFMYIPLPM